MANWRWRHWEFRLGRWRLSRRCHGAPCGYVEDQRHPLRVWRIRG